jgi:hypothetical protein
MVRSARSLQVALAAALVLAVFAQPTFAAPRTSLGELFIAAG